MINTCMKINEYIINERNKNAKIVYTSQDAEEAFHDADKGRTGADFDVRKELKTVHDRYGVEMVDDFAEFNKQNDNRSNSDGKKSLINKKT